MTQSQSTHSCPNCGSAELYLIGAVLRGKSGVKYEGNLRDSIKDIGPEIYEGLLICKVCKHQTTTRTADPLNQLEATDCMWETTALGTKIPIVCPICTNRKLFTKVTLEQRVRAVTYAPDNAGVFKAQDQGVVLGAIEQLVLRYLCDTDNCAGVITIYDEDKYTLKRDLNDQTLE